MSIGFVSAPVQNADEKLSKIATFLLDEHNVTCDRYDTGED